jgi:hypothetical protein
MILQSKTKNDIWEVFSSAGMVKPTVFTIHQKPFEPYAQ